MSVWGEENWILVSMWESCIMELLFKERGFLHGDNS